MQPQLRTLVAAAAAAVVGLAAWSGPVLAADEAPPARVEPGPADGLTPKERPGAPEAKGAALSDGAADADDLTHLDLEDLMTVEVTSVSRRRQRLSEAPAAVSVITQEDIRRSGLTSLPELLRLVPGLQVARVDASNWAVSSRGFNDLYSNKLLVQIDGRTVYNPLFSGVYWDAQDVLLQDLDRVEVIRGPGASLWGANAVNGIVSVTTKSARETQGWLLSGTGGSHEGIGAVRYGGAVGEDTYFRVFSQYRHTEEFETPPGGPPANDQWDLTLGGFRIDHFAGEADVLTLQGDVYNGSKGATFRFPAAAPPFNAVEPAVVHTGGGNVLGRWTHAIADRSDVALQLYYDQVHRDDPQADYRQHTLDLDFQHRFPLGERQDLVWGLGYRFMTDQVHSSPAFGLRHETRDEHLFNAFVQDDLTLVPDRLHLVLGTKFEHNDRTGVEVQPTARGIWTPDERNTLWAAVSRAVRTPNHAEEEGRLLSSTGVTDGTGGVPPGLPTRVDVLGNDDFDAEELTAYELGYRVAPTPALTVDVTGFVNVYDNLRSVTPGTPALEGVPPAATVVIPARIGNDVYGETYGVEVAAHWAVAEYWRITASYSLLDAALHRRRGAADPGEERGPEGSSPMNQVQLRSYLDITRDLQFNALAFYVDRLRTSDTPAYVRLDLNLAWRPRDGLELRAGVQNVLDDRHPEFGDPLYNENTEVPRTFFAQLTWRF